jgi:NAD+ diphosphatase
MLDAATAQFVAQTFLPDAADPEQAVAPAAYWFLFQGDRLVVQGNGDDVAIPCWTDPASMGLAPVRCQVLGYLTDGARRVACMSGELPPDLSLGTGLRADNLRTLYPQLGDGWFQLAGRAVQVVTWDATHQFCGRCGGPMETLAHERAKRCPACGLSNYPRLSPAIIIAVTKQTAAGKRLLMARNHRFPAGRYSVIAGFVEPGESLEECAAREVREEVGLTITNIRYFGSQPWPFPNSLMLGFTADYAEGEITLEPEEIADAGWFAADNLPQLPPKPSIARRLIDVFIAESEMTEMAR